jgi:hypothetical protein
MRAYPAQFYFFDAPVVPAVTLVVYIFRSWAHNNCEAGRPEKSKKQPVNTAWSPKLPFFEKMLSGNSSVTL